MNIRTRAANGLAQLPLTPVKVLTVVAVSVLAVGCAAPTEAPTEPTPVAPSVTLPISYNEVMVAAVDHAAHELWDAVLEENMPQNDEDWTELEHHAIQLVTASTTILLPGTGVGDAVWAESPDWERLSTELRDISLTALESVQNQDIQGLSDAGDALVENCTTCHETFKPEVPSEGVLHPHYR